MLPKTLAEGIQIVYDGDFQELALLDIPIALAISEIPLVLAGKDLTLDFSTVRMILAKKLGFTEALRKNFIEKALKDLGEPPLITSSEAQEFQGKVKLAYIREIKNWLEI